MAVTTDQMTVWCSALLETKAATALSLEDQLAQIPRLSTLDDVAGGTTVLVRGDVDAKPGSEIGQGDIRLRSMLETLRFGQQRGWKQVIFGHLGRKPEGSLAKVRNRLGQLLNRPVELIEDWLDESSMIVPDAVVRQIRAAEPGAIFLLENVRKYEIERALWKATVDDLPRLAPSLCALANEMAEKIARVYVHEAFSAGSLDASSTVVPAAMSRVAMGQYEYAQFDGPLRRCLKTQLVIFSGLKIDKLDDLQAMIDRGTIRRVLSAGSLAMSLKKAAAELDGATFSLGVAEDPQHSDKPYYIPPDRVDQARRMLAEGRKKGIRFILPLDFVLADGRVAERLGPGDQQLDVGPKSSEKFEQAVDEWITESVGSSTDEPPVAFHNGVFGKFEDPRFEQGTKRFVRQLKRMKDAGVEVYVGGGEGGAALEKYGHTDWVTHVFTAGGTVLNVLGNEPVPYVTALRMAAGGEP